MSQTIYTNDGKKWVWQQTLLAALSDKSPGGRFVDFCVSNPDKVCQLREHGDPVKTYDPEKHRHLIEGRIKQKRKEAKPVGKTRRVRLERGKKKGDRGGQVQSLFGA
jgi:hypothetical protein